ncbi:MAG: methylisocitrate lyase [Thermogemmata sp.]|nr:methylisocitrate lyase [Gemmataceae bacterium]
MNSSPTPGERLRRAWEGDVLAVPGVFCPLVAKMAERMGFPAVYLSGGGLSASLGLPDIGLITLTEVVQQAQAISQATSLPLICDADTGFGSSVNVERTVRQLEAAGVAGLHLEDQELPKRCGHLSGKTLISAEEMAAKIQAAVAARRDPSLVIIARTDARGVSGLEEAIRRARLYKQAGADVIFPEALESAEEFAVFAQEVGGPLLANMTEFGRSPLLERTRLAQWGYRLVLYPLTALRMALRAAEAALRHLLTTDHQRELLPQMFTRAELYDLLDYRGYEERDRQYFGWGPAGQ